MIQARSRLESIESKFSVVNDIYFTNDFYLIEEGNSNDSKTSKLLNKNNNYHHETNNFKASIFVLIASFSLSIVNLCGKIIGFYYPEDNVHISNFIRGIILIILSHIFFFYKKIDIKREIFHEKSKDKLVFMFSRSFFGATCNILFFLSLKHMRISSAFTIFSLSPIFVSILTFLILKEKFSNFDIFSLLACFSSVCLITKPEFLFGSLNQGDGDSFIGFIFALFSAMSNSISVFLTKKISKDFHFSVAPYIMGYLYIIETSILIFFSDKGFSSLSIVPFILSIFLSSIFFVNLYLFIYSLLIGDPIKILPITYTGVVFTLIYNRFIFHQSTDILDIFGSFTIMFLNIYKTISHKN